MLRDSSPVSAIFQGDTHRKALVQRLAAWGSRRPISVRRQNRQVLRAGPSEAALEMSHKFAIQHSDARGEFLIQSVPGHLPSAPVHGPLPFVALVRHRLDCELQSEGAMEI